jgi:hypothetical protein
MIEHGFRGFGVAVEGVCGNGFGIISLEGEDLFHVGVNGILKLCGWALSY